MRASHYGHCSDSLAEHGTTSHRIQFLLVELGHKQLEKEEKA